jgi:hypothetical protein
VTPFGLQVVAEFRAIEAAALAAVESRLAAFSALVND